MFSKILNYDVFSESKSDLLKYMENYKKINIISGNPEILYNGIKNKDLFNGFTSENSVIIPDGVGVVIASKIAGSPVKEKIAGIDVMSELLKKCETEKKSVYLLGAKEEVVHECTRKLKLNYPELNIAGYHNGYFDIENCDEIIDDIKINNPYVLFVAMGSPKQENFLSKYMDNLPCSIFMGVGGCFDIFAGNLKRAPEWMIDAGMEWLYRVIKEPRRIKRLAAIPKFLIMVLCYTYFRKMP